MFIDMNWSSPEGQSLVSGGQGIPWVSLCCSSVLQLTLDACYSMDLRRGLRFNHVNRAGLIKGWNGRLESVPCFILLVFMGGTLFYK